MTEELRSFIRAAMTFDRHLRPSAEDLLSHPLFAVG
jgi:serine/threonine protein kinase